jgi:hypothetical protein
MPFSNPRKSEQMMKSKQEITGDDNKQTKFKRRKDFLHHTSTSNLEQLHSRICFTQVLPTTG